MTDSVSYPCVTRAFRQNTRTIEKRHEKKRFNTVHSILCEFEGL